MSGSQREEKSTIDYFLMARRRVVKDVKVIRQAEVGSNNFLLRMKLKTRNVIIKKYKWRIRVNKKISSHKLKELTHRLNYQVTLQKKLDFNESKDLEEKWRKCKDTILQAAKECYGVKNIISDMVNNIVLVKAGEPFKLYNATVKWEIYC